MAPCSFLWIRAGTPPPPCLLIGTGAVSFFRGSEVFVVPAPFLDEFIFDIDALGRDPQLFLEDAADEACHALAGIVVGASEELHRHHGHGEIVVAAEPHTGVVLKIQHEPVFALAGEGGNGLAEASLDGVFLFGGEREVDFGVDKGHDDLLLRLFCLVVLSVAQKEGIVNRFREALSGFFRFFMVKTKKYCNKMRKNLFVRLTIGKIHGMIITVFNIFLMEEPTMKSKRIHLAANLVLWIGLIAGLLGCIVALLLAEGNPLGLPTDYVPTQNDFIYIGIGLAAIIVISIILHVIANCCASREKIRACWAEAAVEEAPVEEAPVEEAVEETVEEEAVEEIAEEEPKTRLQIIYANIYDKVKEKTNLTDEQLEKAKKVGKVALPVGAACVSLAVLAKLGHYRKQAKNRAQFYKWLG